MMKPLDYHNPPHKNSQELARIPFEAPWIPAGGYSKEKWRDRKSFQENWNLWSNFPFSLGPIDGPISLAKCITCRTPNLDGRRKPSTRELADKEAEEN